MSPCFEGFDGRNDMRDPKDILVKVNTLLHFTSCIHEKMGFTQGRIDYSRDFGKEVRYDL